MAVTITTENSANIIYIFDICKFLRKFSANYFVIYSSVITNIVAEQVIGAWQ
jgi:hypothetical protein